MPPLFAAAVLAVAVAEAAAPSGSSLLEARAFDPLPVGSITPKGWLLQQLKLQAEGLSGHLAQFWDDVMDSVWIGGKADGGLHERVPYWLNGIVPLAFLLKNAGIEELSPVIGIYKAPSGGHDAVHCRVGAPARGQSISGSGFKVNSTRECRDRCAAHRGCHGYVVDQCGDAPTCWLTEGADAGSAAATTTTACSCYGVLLPEPEPVDLIAQTQKYISYILQHQNPSGWLGPDGSTDPDQYWGPSNVLQALYQYAEGSGDAAIFRTGTQAIVMHLLEQKRRMATIEFSRTKPATLPFGSAFWASRRWMDVGLTVEWLLDNADVGEHQQELVDLLHMLHDQGQDWEAWFETFQGAAGNHNVNNAQALKSAAVIYRMNKTATHGGFTMPQLSRRRMDNLDRIYGLPTGMFNGDELLPQPASRSPSRGIELCGVVEAMFSYNVMFSVHGTPAFAERAERIALNALPATWASPKGGDMWAHQYLQAVNEINAIKANPHVWQNDGDLAETYGLEPNFGCCTANFHQGWPKYADMLFYTAPDGGPVVALWAPASAKFPNGVVVDVATEYPFEDSAVVTVTSGAPVSVYLRIPDWATSATVNGKPAANGTMWKGSAGQGTSLFTVDFKPQVRLEEWDAGAASVHRGALMYSLPITPKYTTYAHHFGTDDMSNDYYLDPASPWQFALDADPADLEASLKFSSIGYKEGSSPFNHSGWPSQLLATVRPLNWSTSLNSADPPPASPACLPSAGAAASTCGPPQQQIFAPHGSTELRIGELPLAFHRPGDAHLAMKSVVFI